MLEALFKKKFLRTPILKKICKRLFLKVASSINCCFDGEGRGMGQIFHFSLGSDFVCSTSKDFCKEMKDFIKPKITRNLDKKILIVCLFPEVQPRMLVRNNWISCRYSDVKYSFTFHLLVSSLIKVYYREEKLREKVNGNDIFFSTEGKTLFKDE